MEKIANLGDLGDVVKVKDGYARNFLIPHGKAKRATAGEPARRSRRKRAELEKAQADDARQGAGARREARRPHAADHAEGRASTGACSARSPTTTSSKRWRSRATRSSARNIRMPQGPLKQVGDYPIEIALHTDVAVTITVVGARRAVSAFRRRMQKGPAGPFVFRQRRSKSLCSQVNHRSSTASRPASAEFQTLSARVLWKRVSSAGIYFPVAERVCL